MTKPYSSDTNSSSSKLSTKRDSHTISKFKPKIRIIHIYAPEIIKTDAENFRELVQRLTGKPKCEGGGSKNTKESVQSHDLLTLYPNPDMVMEGSNGLVDLQRGVRIKDEVTEEHAWRTSPNNTFGYGLSELDGFLEEMLQ